MAENDASRKRDGGRQTPAEEGSDGSVDGSMDGSIDESVATRTSTKRSGRGRGELKCYTNRLSVYYTNGLILTWELRLPCTW